jgi:hypothetical protein
MLLIGQSEGYVADWSVGGGAMLLIGQLEGYVADWSVGGC